MYVYIKDGGYHKVGFYDPKGEFIIETLCDSKAEAAARVSYLNGGLPPETKSR
jgi:hypothetical protein